MQTAWGAAAALAMLAVAAVWAALNAYYQGQLALANLHEMQIEQSRSLAEQARQQRAAGDAGSAVLLAIEALPRDVTGTDRPYVPEAELRLDGAWRDLRERLVLVQNIRETTTFSPDGKRIVTASEDKTARVRDAESGKPIGEALEGHTKALTSAAFSSDGERIVTASEDKTARVWDAATGKPLGAPLRHDDLVFSAAFSPDGTRIVTVSLDKTARVWDAATGQPIDELRVHTDVSKLAEFRFLKSAEFSPDGKRIITTYYWDKTHMGRGDWSANRRAADWP